MECSELVFSVSKRYVGNEDFKDAAQNSFIKIFQGIKKYKGTEKEIKAWVIKITVNESLQLLRRKKRLSNQESTLKVLSVERPSILQQLSVADIQECISKIELNHRLVFMMYALEGFSHKEIANKLNIAETSSRARYSRSKAMIKVQLQRIKDYENARRI